MFTLLKWRPKTDFLVLAPFSVAQSAEMMIIDVTSHSADCIPTERVVAMPYTGRSAFKTHFR